MGAVALGGEVEEQALGEMLFVFDEGDEGDSLIRSILMRGGIGEGEGEGDGGAEVGAGAGGGDAAAVLAGDGADEEEAEAGALDADSVAAGDAVEALEDALELVGGDADAGVGDGERDVGVFGRWRVSRGRGPRWGST